MEWQRPPKGTFAASLKLIFFIVVPGFALLATVRAVMTTLGLDQVHWGQWGAAFFGEAGMNLILPVLLAILTVVTGLAIPVWDTIRSLPGEYAAAARNKRGVTLVFAFMVLPFLAVWAFPVAWTHWVTWFAVGLVACLGILWHRLFRLQPRTEGVMQAASAVAGCALAAALLHHVHMKTAALWAFPLVSMLVPFVLAAMASSAVAALYERRNGSSPTGADGCSTTPR